MVDVEPKRKILRKRQSTPRPRNPYAIYVYCDGSMNYDSKNTGGIGFTIDFPDFVALETIFESFGSYHDANIERLEMQAIIQGMESVLRVYKMEEQKLSRVNKIIVITDRQGLSDQERTNQIKIAEWRKNGWHNFEGKAIKNHDLLDNIDKTRKKLSAVSFCGISIEHRRRKFNKVADKLARDGKLQFKSKKQISIRGTKIGGRIFDGSEIGYRFFKKDTILKLHIYKKDPVLDQWEISAEIFEGYMICRKLKIYSTDNIAKKLQRGHLYNVRIKQVFKHHIIVYDEVEDRGTKKDLQK